MPRIAGHLAHNVSKCGDEAFPFPVDLLQSCDKCPVLAGRKGLDTIEEGRTEKPVAAVRSQGATQSAALLSQELAGLGVRDVFPVVRRSFPQRVKIDDITLIMVRMPVQAADPLTVRTDSRRMLFYEGTQRLHSIGSLPGEFSQPGHFTAGDEERLLHLIADAFKDDVPFMKIHILHATLTLDIHTKKRAANVLKKVHNLRHRMAPVYGHKPFSECHSG